LYDLSGIGPLAAQALPFRSGLQDLHPHREALPELGIIAPGILSVTPYIKAEDKGVGGLAERPPDAVETLRGVYPPAPGPSALREDQDAPSTPEEPQALLQHGPHILPVPAALHGDALGEIAEGGQKA
jgi:hypothetical protein